MMGHVLLAMAVLTGSTPVARTPLSVLTWNVCTGTNSLCPIYRAGGVELAGTIAELAASGSIKPDVIFLQEFCTGVSAQLEAGLEARTGRPWTVRAWGLGGADGKPYACHPDRLGRSRGAQSVTLAVAGDGVTFQTHPLAAPRWYVTRAALCATIPAKKVHACGTHLSSGSGYDDHQPGAPYRTRQIRQLLAAAAKPGHRTIVGGDLNVAPPDSGDGGAAGRRAVVPAYRAYQECDQRGPRRTGRWTHTGANGRKKLDYLFAPKGTVTGCRVDKALTVSDHKPLFMKVAL
ncbi:endonuclease/exonuclease/phosphatase family protein [Nonomuraea sp. NN258]|uniref:endonuclease/exonuclease/phosphatase family protein n=1 Tax=Nonomuraea antri TaxID=2730852 RepID=UPI001569C947|nr:endonuclease/exonuclease/phosphatase family protein [Nonomuraea antri]NRQ32041.1 endonuclease/exonuclease/phosphatase family protein [Nonomuraea antri]